MVIGAMAIYQCANPVAPSGGPKDTTPPRLLKDKSTANEQTNYTPKSIVLYFDEYVEVQNPGRNVIISPPLDPKPDYEVGSDYLKIDFTKADSLQKNTTYSLNFDNAVSDFNEGNPVENLLFVFSTGDFLDSLELLVEVIDKEKKPVEGITVMLYPAAENDSVVVKSLPSYFSKTNKQGEANLRYLREGVYKIFGLQDDNLTLKYDIPTAAIAFKKEPIEVTADSLQKVLLQLFTPEPTPQMTKKPFFKNNAYVAVFTPLDTTITCSVSPASAAIARRWQNDSLYIWLDPTMNLDSLVWTSDIREKLRRDTLAAPSSIDTFPIRGLTKSLAFINKKASLSWNQPMELLSDSTFFVQDSSGQRFYLTTSEQKYLRVDVQLPLDSLPTPSREMIALPGQLRSYYGYTNKDTLRWSFKSVEEADLSELKLILRFPDSIAHYRIQLIKGSTVVKERLCTRQNEYIWDIPLLEPGSYKVKIYEDQNQNGRQDGGDYWKGQQAEPWKEYSLESLRANWTIEEEIEWENETGSKESN